MNDQNSGIFAAAEIGNAIDKASYDSAIETLRVDLLNLQFDLKDKDFSLIILLAGDDRPGAIAAARVLHDWMDERHIRTNVMFDDDGENGDKRPVLYRYWARLPMNGSIGLFLGGWPTWAVRTALVRDWERLELDGVLDHMERFEQELALDGTLLLKFWFHLPKEQHLKRLKDAENNPDRYWHFEQRDWDILESYDKGLGLVEHMIRRTNSPHAPWTIVESSDERYRNLTMATQIARMLQARLEQKPVVAAQDRTSMGALPGQNLLEQIDLSLTVTEGEYPERFRQLQARLNELARAVDFAGIASVVVFEGVDAAGKGGTIRRVSAAIPIQNVRVIPIAAPSEEERSHHYLWRFWRRLPAGGDMVIFDRSWYGRVLVERVEGFATAEQWGRAYEELNDFEALLDQSGMPVVKFWLQIDQEEQLRRFEARAKTPYKKYKLTDDDFRNREKWTQYQEAAHDMLARTSTSYAPWHTLPANDKKYARLRALEIVGDRLEAQLVANLGKNWRKQIPQGPAKQAKKARKTKKKG
jgi:polyphosphate:AMP phosphotransferase